MKGPKICVARRRNENLISTGEDHAIFDRNCIYASAAILPEVRAKLKSAGETPLGLMTSNCPYCIMYWKRTMTDDKTKGYGMVLRNGSK